jgi:hypothetical protein
MGLFVTRMRNTWSKALLAFRVGAFDRGSGLVWMIDFTEDLTCDRGAP